MWKVPVPRMDPITDRVVRSPLRMAGTSLRLLPKTSPDSRDILGKGKGGNMKRTIAVLMGLLILLLCSTTVWAQVTAQISGTVKDQTGAVLPGVEVTASNTGTGVSRTAVTNE